MSDKYLMKRICSEAPSRIVERSEGSRFPTGTKPTKVRLRCEERTVRLLIINHDQNQMSIKFLSSDKKGTAIIMMVEEAMGYTKKKCSQIPELPTLKN